MSGAMQFYTGVVENRNDELKLGRCQVRVVGIHTADKTQLPTEDLPWAFPVSPITSAGVSGVGTAPIGPVEGTWVLIMFMDPDCQKPMMMGTLNGAAQTPDALNDNVFTVNTVDTSGAVTDSTSPLQATTTVADDSQTSDTQLPSGKVVEGDSIIGPLAKLIAKAESGADGYNAYNRGTVNGKIVPGSGKLELTKMPIKDIMAKQALPPSSPDRLFAVGKYQTIPVTLKAACQALNIDINQPFTEKTQDIICQEYLVAKKRPALVAYYRNPDRNNEKFLMDAGQSLAAEFASVEDPYFPGYPYKGPEGTYYKSGNRAHTKWSTIKTTLQSEWDFRNNSKNPPPTAKIADNDKVDKGTDYIGVAKLAPVDDSIATPAKQSASAPQAESTPVVPSVSTNLNPLDSIMAAVNSSLDQLTSSLNLNEAISEISEGASSLLGEFGSSISEIAANLGIENISGSVTELAANLGLANPSKQSIIAELEKRAGSTQGQAKSLLNKIESEGEPTAPATAPIGSKNSDGTVSGGTSVNPNVGFQDPSGVYPKYRNEQDTNRLATGNNLGRTVVLKKEAALKTGVRIANGGTWDQSPVPYNAKYPYNKVTQTESGHVQEMDDTPGSERIHTYHKSGSFTEIDANGTRVNRIVGDGFEILERNGFVYVQGAYCVTVDGAMNLRTDNVFNLEVSGAANINIFNDANINVSGSANLAVGAVLNAKANKINLESVGQFNIKAGSGLNIEAGMDINVKSAASMNTETKGNINQKTAGGVFTQAEADVNLKTSGGMLNFESSNALNIKSGENLNLQSGGQASLLASGIVAIDGDIVDISNGSSNSAESAEDADSARSAGFAEIELPVETRGTSGVSQLPPLTVPNRSTEYAFDSPNSGTTSQINSYKNNRISNNKDSVSNNSATSYVVDESKPSGTSAAVGIVSDYSLILNMATSHFVPGMRLSENWTLGELTAGGTRIPRQNYQVRYGVRSTQYVTITPQEIVANLKAVCDNVLEPLTKKYGKNTFTITSAFRRPSQGKIMGDLGVPEDSSDHCIGSAVDFVFKNGKTRTFEVVKELPSYLKCWNQIIMEYNGPSSYWIHVAYKRERSNAGHCFTMNYASEDLYLGTLPNGGFKLI